MSRADTGRVPQDGIKYYIKMDFGDCSNNSAWSFGKSIPAIIPFALEHKSKLLDQDLKEAVQIVKNNNLEAGSFDDMVHNEIEKIRAERRGEAKIIIIILTSAMLLIVMFQHIKILSIELSISHFEQCINACLPYLTDDEHKKLLSDFALIKSKDDYSAIMGELEEVAKRSNLALPA